MFGSYAKGNSYEESDIDLVVETPIEMDPLKFYEIRGRLETTLKKDVDLIDMSEIVVGSKVDKEIKKTGVIIYEK